MVIAKAGWAIPGPFREWIDAQVREAGGEIQALADLLGVNEARVRRIGVATADQSGLVRIETVDDWMTRFGASVAQLYGPLYRLPIPEKDACGENCLTCNAPLREPAPLCGFCIEEGRAA